MIDVKNNEMKKILNRISENPKPILYICSYFLRFRMDKKTAAFYERLKAELDINNPVWPAEYLFKFIVPTDHEKIQKVEDAFNCLGAVIKTTKSKTGKFTSISIDVQMKSAQEIIDKYLAVSTIEGIISL